MIKLPPGHYSAEITLLKDMPNFDRTGIYAHVIYFTSESLRWAQTKILVADIKFDSYWYNIWDFTKWLAKQFYCIKFCADPLDLNKPIDVTNADESTSVNFEVHKTGKYIFYLLFDKGDDWGEIKKRLQLIRGSNGKGTVIPISLQLIKDGKVYFEDEIDTIGSDASRYIHYKQDRIDVAERSIRVIDLPSGVYTAKFTILSDNPALNGVSSFVDVSYFKYQDKYFFKKEYLTWKRNIQ